MRSARRARRRAVRAAALTSAMIAAGVRGAKIAPPVPPASGPRSCARVSGEASAAPEGDRFREAAAFLGGLIGIQIGVIPLQEAPPRGREADGGALDGQPEQRQQALGLLRERLPSFPDRTRRGRAPALCDAQPPAKV